ncbi:hypothetical protein FALBO_9562 [Fusarium albosuccineum]|uniref:Heterokaryon incompatibility domain-containing protein n=1 Tax=Fusarium albosuccineum TaxID=1237068 RepID=A0A8H4L8L7_9HYPO|nr:hypothetical protein FALBO_9562 [Fusarium albosuccineum]
MGSENPRNDAPGVLPAELCDKCRTISLNDGMGQDANEASPVEADDRLGMVDGTTFELDYQLDDLAPRFPYLLASADNGCHFCRALYEAFTVDEKTKEIMHQLPSGREHPVVGEMKYVYDEDEDDVENNTRENGALRLTLTMLRKGQEEPWLFFDFLVEGVPALSYCWGNAQDAQDQTKTTEQSLPQKLVEIESNSLSPVIRDAVQITRSLSIPYLWIDALCILQGHVSDWSQHACVMDKIYGSARVTVAALSSESCNQQFRFATTLPLYIPFQSTLNPSVSGFYRLRYLGIGRFDKLRKNELVNQTTFFNIGNSRWRSRGWTFQEDVTSSRVLFFGRSDIFFTCPSSQQCFGGNECLETCGDRISDPVYNWSNPMQVHLYWLEFASNYSDRCNFTRNTDLLPAISGLASFFRRKLKCRSTDYVAGLWKDYLHIGVLWCKSAWLKQHKPTLGECLADLAAGPFICPSWTWANHGEVVFLCFDHVNYRKRCQIDVRTTVKGSDPYGEIEVAFLSVTGKVATLDSEFLTRATNEAEYGEWCKWRPKKRGIRAYWRFWLDWDPSVSTEAWGDLKMLLLGSAQGSEDEGRSVFGLLIHKVGISDPSEFSKVGVFFSASGVNFTEEWGLRLVDRGRSSVVRLI